jgi:hypothetical protein
MKTSSGAGGVMDAAGAHYGWPEDEDPFSLRAALRHF